MEPSELFYSLCVGHQNGDLKPITSLLFLQQKKKKKKKKKVYLGSAESDNLGSATAASHMQVPTVREGEDFTDGERKLGRLQ